MLVVKVAPLTLAVDTKALLVGSIPYLLVPFKNVPPDMLRSANVEFNWIQLPPVVTFVFVKVTELAPSIRIPGDVAAALFPTLQLIKVNDVVTD